MGIWVFVCACIICWLHSALSTTHTPQGTHESQKGGAVLGAAGNELPTAAFSFCSDRRPVLGAAGNELTTAAFSFCSDRSVRASSSSFMVDNMGCPMRAPNRIITAATAMPIMSRLFSPTDFSVVYRSPGRTQAAKYRRANRRMAPIVIKTKKKFP